MAKCVVYGEVACLRHAVEREMAESRHAAASLRVPGYVRVSSLRDEMRLSGCLYNRSSAVSLGVTCEAFARTKKLPDSLIAAAQCTNYSLVLPWHFKLKDKQIETL